MERVGRYLPRRVGADESVAGGVVSDSQATRWAAGLEARAGGRAICLPAAQICAEFQQGSGFNRAINAGRSYICYL
jgi:hypothetical protein